MLIEALGGGGARFIVSAHSDDSYAPGSDCLGPDDSAIVVARLDDRTDEARDADSVATHMREDRRSVSARDLESHRRRIFFAKVEDVPNLDAAAGALLFL